MVTFNQYIHKIRKQRRVKISKPILGGKPQRRALCKRLYIMKPKKPNSARRRVAKLLLYKSQKGFIGYIPGNVHTLQEFANVLVRGGRVRDLPGVRYKIIRGVLDCQSLAFRRTGRSKYGTKWWWRVQGDTKSVRVLKKLELKKEIFLRIQDNVNTTIFTKLMLLNLAKSRNNFVYAMNKKRKISFFFLMKLKIIVKNKKIKLFSFYYSSLLFYKFITSFLKKGRRKVFLKIVISLFKLLKEKLLLNPLYVIFFLIKKSLISFKLFTIKKAGRSYKIAQPITFEKQFLYAIKALLKINKNKKAIVSSKFLFEEFLLLLSNSSKSKIILTINELLNIAIEDQSNINYKTELKKRSHLVNFKNIKSYKFGYNKFNLFITNLNKNEISPGLVVNTTEEILKMDTAFYNSLLISKYFYNTQLFFNNFSFFNQFLKQILIYTLCGNYFSLKFISYSNYFLVFYFFRLFFKIKYYTFLKFFTKKNYLINMNNNNTFFKHVLCLNYYKSELFYKKFKSIIYYIYFCTLQQKYFSKLYLR